MTMETTIDLMSLPEVYREALCLHFALAGLGVRSEHIFFAASPEGEVVVLVKPGGADGPPVLSVSAGRAPSDFREIWPAACRAWNQIGTETVTRIWEQSGVRRHLAGLITALTLTGAMKSGRIALADPVTDPSIPEVNSRGGQA